MTIQMCLLRSPIFLESAAYDTRSFASAKALLAAGFEGLTLLVSDIGMPGLDGFEHRDAARRALTCRYW
jgi:FixJ family two-component response regulator